MISISTFVSISVGSFKLPTCPVPIFYFDDTDPEVLSSFRKFSSGAIVGGLTKVSPQIYLSNGAGSDC